MSAMELERRGHLGVSRELSHGPDIRPDINLSAQMSNDYVKVENFERWKKLNETVLRARTLKSFITGAIFGILVLVAIIMAGVSLGKIATHEVKKVNLKDHEDGLKAKQKMIDALESSLEKKIELGVLEAKLRDLKSQITIDYRSYADSVVPVCSCPSG